WSLDRERVQRNGRFIGLGVADTAREQRRHEPFGMRLELTVDVGTGGVVGRGVTDKAERVQELVVEPIGTDGRSRHAVANSASASPAIPRAAWVSATSWARCSSSRAMVTSDPTRRVRRAAPR